MPIDRGEKRSVEVVKVTEEMKAFKDFSKLCVEGMNQRQPMSCSDSYFVWLADSGDILSSTW
jgi:hypothetical protein